MATAQEVMVQDLPPELLDATPAERAQTVDWERALAGWASQQLASKGPDEPGVLNDALPKFERIMIQQALKQTGGRKRDASLLLGWGRNTLTRKIADLGLSDETLVD